MIRRRKGDSPGAGRRWFFWFRQTRSSLVRRCAYQAPHLLTIRSVVPYESSLKPWRQAWPPVRAYHGRAPRTLQGQDLMWPRPAGTSAHLPARCWATPDRFASATAQYFRELIMHSNRICRETRRPDLQGKYRSPVEIQPAEELFVFNHLWRALTAPYDRAFKSW
jgi:hypothetical protein